jgi:hypothetical protein
MFLNKDPVLRLFRQNGPIPLIDDVISILNIGFSLKKIRSQCEECFAKMAQAIMALLTFLTLYFFPYLYYIALINKIRCNAVKNGVGLLRTFF